MTARKQSSPTVRTTASRWKRWAVIGCAVLALAGVLVFGRAVASWQARLTAARDIERGAVGAAQRWLAWSGWLAPHDYRTDLMSAACHRHLGQQDEWRVALETAEHMGGRTKEWRLEQRLGEFHWGQTDRITIAHFETLVAFGAPPREAIAAVVHGLLAKGEPQNVLPLIDSWQPDSTDKLHASYLRGLYYWAVEQWDRAQEEFGIVLLKQPSHELARAGLARLLEQQDRLTQALEHYSFLATAAPEREAVHVDLARVLRKLVRIKDAESVLRRPVPRDDVSQSVAVELAQREFESGNYAEARQWFADADLEGAHVADTLLAAATAFALDRRFADAQRLFERIEDAQSFSRHAGELQRRLAIDPHDSIAAGELQRLMEHSADAGARRDEPPENVSPLYLELCAACHGPNGNGKGRAARHVFPRPRDFQSDQFRLISTRNSVPNRNDIEGVIRRGVPGTSMPPFPEITVAQLERLTDQVERFREQGIRARTIAGLERESEPIDEGSLRRIVSLFTTPSEVVPIPTVHPATPQSVENGKVIYFKLGCYQCHGNNGIGALDTPLFDEAGRHITPRDLTTDPMKGGPGAEALAQRIRLGMPGTPHPAVPSISDEELVSLVHFCLSLATGQLRVLTNHQRALDAWDG